MNGLPAGILQRLPSREVARYWYLISESTAVWCDVCDSEKDLLEFAVVPVAVTIGHAWLCGRISLYAYVRYV